MSAVQSSVLRCCLCLAVTGLVHFVPKWTNPHLVEELIVIEAKLRVAGIAGKDIPIGHFSVNVEPQFAIVNSLGIFSDVPVDDRIVEMPSSKR